MLKLDPNSLLNVTSFLRLEDRVSLGKAFPSEASCLKEGDWELRAALDPKIKKNCYLKAYGMTCSKQEPSILNSVIASIWKILFRS